MSVTADETTPAWSSYIDLNNDLKPYLQIPAGTTSYDSTLQLLIDSECQWVQNYLGRPVAPTQFYRKFTNTGSNYTVELPYCPVLSIDAIVETWGLNGQHALTYQTPENQGGAGDQMYTMNWLEGQIIRTYQGLIARPFFVGTRNLEVTWTAGYNPLPADIKRATMLLVKERWNQEQQASRGPKPASSGMPMYEPQDGYMMSVQAEVKRYLEPFSQIGIG
jgi:hypothetical protein